ncbi:MAG: hypothetical protein ABR592_01990 [Nitriliruptorales bacterium]
MKKLAIGAALIGVLAVGCGGSSASAPGAPASTPTTAEQNRLARDQAHRKMVAAQPCAPASDVISSRMIYGARPTNLQAVKAITRVNRDGSPADVWFVAAELEGPGIEGPGDTAVWATSNLTNPGSYNAVDHLAQSFSTITHADEENWPVSDPFVARAKECVEEAS